MRLNKVKSTNEISLQIIKDVNINGKRTTKVVESLGTERSLRKKLDGADPYIWINDYIAKLNQKEKEGSREIIVKYSPAKLVEKNKQHSYNSGYLFLQQLFYQLKLDEIFKSIQDKYKFTFSINDIMSKLIYSRILFPNSKKATYELSKRYLEGPLFDEHQIYRALDYIYEEMDFIQASLYKNSQKVLKRNTKVLFYDCTNFFFTSEQEEGIKQYGLSKDHQPAPLVQMGLFMDGNGIPLTMAITPGNTNEQTTLRPLEKKIIKDFGLSEIIVCTDAGLASAANRKFNNIAKRSFVTTQSIKMLKGYLKKWSLDTNDWKLTSSNKTYNIKEIQDDLELECSYKEYQNKLNRIYYKERWIIEDNLEQRLIVTYSPKTKRYQKNIRDRQVERAKNAINSGKKNFKVKNSNDYRRFIETIDYTNNGEVAQNATYFINEDVYKREEEYDGYYAVCTNLEDDIREIIKINKGRWEIEESFRIMKSEFKSRPVHHRLDNRIEVHFLICFIALLIYRILEKKLDERFTVSEIISCLKNMNMHKTKGEDYLPSYTRDDLTDALHNLVNFRTDHEITSNKNMRKILKLSKK